MKGDEQQIRRYSQRLIGIGNSSAMIDRLVRVYILRRDGYLQQGIDQANLSLDEPPWALRS